jgi:hypothetical protein
MDTKTSIYVTMPREPGRARVYIWSITESGTATNPRLQEDKHVILAATTSLNHSKRPWVRDSQARRPSHFVLSVPQAQGRLTQAGRGEKPGIKYIINPVLCPIKKRVHLRWVVKRVLVGLEV